jgi:hypothetical protein
MKMKHSEALRVLGVEANVSFDDMKSAYRKLSMQYHPDRNVMGLEMMKLINGAYQALSDYDFSGVHALEEESELSLSEELSIALNAIAGLGLTIEICGSWIWVSGDTRPHRELLKSAGYRWAPKKLMWSYGTTKTSSRGKYSMDDIRNKHGSVSYKSSTWRKIA